MDDGQPIGEDTERELSLSREDDSDLSVVSDYPEEEYKNNNNNQNAGLALLAQNRSINDFNNSGGVSASSQLLMQHQQKLHNQ